MWIFLGVITKGVICMHFRVVSKGQGTELGIFFGLVVKFQLFGGGGLVVVLLYQGSSLRRLNSQSLGEARHASI